MALALHRGAQLAAPLFLLALMAACSNTPICVAAVPVPVPRSLPNKTLSIRSGEIACILVFRGERPIKIICPDSWVDPLTGRDQPG